MARPLAAITGASSGIGSVFARHLAPTYDLLLIARRRERLDEMARELSAQHGATVSVFAADLTDEAQLQLVAGRLSSETNLEMFVNNAGFGNRGLFWETDLAAIEKMHRLHINASLKLIHAALGVMVKQNRGALINVASVASFAQRGGNAGYGASKSWLATFSEGLYLDLKKAKSSVTVQALCPGYTYSAFHDLCRRLLPRRPPQPQAIRHSWMALQTTHSDCVQAPLVAQDSPGSIPGFPQALRRRRSLHLGAAISIQMGSV